MTPVNINTLKLGKTYDREKYTTELQEFLASGVAAAEVYIDDNVKLMTNIQRYKTAQFKLNLDRKQVTVIPRNGKVYMIRNY